MDPEDFIPLSRGVLVHPVLRVALQAGRFDLGSSEQSVHLLYDPAVRAEPATDHPIDISRARALLRWVFTVNAVDGVLQLRLGTGADRLPVIDHLLRRMGPAAVAANPQEFLRAALAASLRLDTWDELAEMFRVSRVTIVVRADFKAALYSESESTMNSSSYVALWSREALKTSSEPIDRSLATDAGRRAFDRELGSLIRRGEFDAAEVFLQQRLNRCRTKIADAARASAPDAVRISGWEDIHAECARFIAAGIPIGAIGLNLSNYNDGPTSVWHDKEPAIEFAVYGTDAFDFSSSTIDELLRISAEPPTPWQGRMLAQPRPVVPSISGLRALNSALLEYANDAPFRPSISSTGAPGTAPDDYVAFALGEWMLHLRFHQSVTRNLDTVGLPLRVPVLIGAHDVGPFIVSVVVPTRLTEPGPAAATVDAAKPVPPDATLNPSVERWLGELDEMRRTIQSLGLFARSKRRALIEQSEARQTQLLQGVGLAWPRRSWEMTDSQFKAFAHAFRLAHDVSNASADER